ncbi:MAG: TIR domain-containing protein [Gammaproteobacteria bacterium]|nr:TIR domain-containing protein [Gammaproteobacteria bacterium]
MEELSHRSFLLKAKSFLSEYKSREKFPALDSIVELLIHHCDKNHDNEPVAVECLISHLRAIRHYIKVKEGKSLYLRAVYSNELDRLIDESERILAPTPFCWGGEIKFPTKATIVKRQDDPVRERKLEQEQLHLDDNPLFHNLLHSIWLYALERGFESKTIFISYAWPVGNIHEEAWTKAFVERLAYHLVSAGFQIYLDDIQGGAGFPLDEFMSKLKKCDHVLLISSRTMQEKLKRQESGVNQEKRKIIEHLEKQDKSFRERVVIPVLLNYQNYCAPMFASLAEVPMCADGYLGSFCKLLPRLFGDSKLAFETWFDAQLKKEQLQLLESVPRLPQHYILRSTIQGQIDANLRNRRIVFLSGGERTGKSTEAIAYCHDFGKKRYQKIYWSEKGQLALSSIPAHSLVVLNDMEDLTIIKSVLKNLSGVDVLITAPEDKFNNAPRVTVDDFNQEQAEQYVKKNLWNSSVHNKEDIQALIKWVGRNPGKLMDVIAEINRDKLNIPRYLKLKSKTENSCDIQRIEILHVLLSRLQEDDHEINEVQAIPRNRLLFKPSESLGLFGVPFRNYNFAGRKSLLLKLEEQLCADALGHLKPVTIVACGGMGGIGKTQLAIEYAHSRQAHYRFIIWVPSSSRAEIERRFREVAVFLGILPVNTSSQEVIRVVKNYFLQKPGNLLIFDGATDFDTVKEFIPERGNSVLITSRTEDGQWPHVEPLKAFDESEVREYVSLALGEHSRQNNEIIDELGRAVYGLPLALAQAVAYIESQGVTISEYLQLYLKNPISLLNDKAMPFLDEHSSVLVTFTLAMEAIAKRSALAKKLITCCGFLHPNTIPGFIFDMLGEGEEIKFALSILSQYALITFAPNYCFDVHQMVQKIVRLQLSSVAQRGYIDFACDVLLKNFPYDENQHGVEHVEKERFLLPHIEKIFSRIEKNKANVNNVLKKLLLRLAKGYEDSGDIPRATLVWKKLVDFCKSFSPELSRDYAFCLYHWGSLLNFPDSETTLLEAYEILKTIYKTDKHPEMEGVLTCLGNCYAARNDKDANALEYYQKALDANLLERNLSFSRVLMLLNIIEIQRRTASVSEKSILIEQLENLIDQLERECGIGHPNISKAFNRLANLCGELGEDTKKYKYAKDALRAKRAFYRGPHREVVITLVDFSNACSHLQKFDEQRECLEEALLMAQSICGENHPEVFIIKGNLGVVWGNLKKVDRQIQYLEEALGFFRSVSGIFYKDVIPQLINLANLYGACGRPDDKIRLLNEALRIIDGLELNNNEIRRYKVITQKSLAAVYCLKREDVDGQIELLQRVYEEEERLYPVGHPSLGITQLEIAIGYGVKKDWEKSFEYAIKARAVFLLHPSIGPEHSYTKNSEAVLLELRPMIINQACTEDIRGNIEGAEKIFQLLMCFPSPSARCEYGVFLCRKGEIIRALKQFRQVLSQAEDNSWHSYDETEIVRVEKRLQKEISENKVLKISSRALALYYVVYCCVSLNEKKDAEKYYAAFKTYAITQHNLVINRIVDFAHVHLESCFRAPSINIWANERGVHADELSGTEKKSPSLPQKK